MKTRTQWSYLLCWKIFYHHLLSYNFLPPMYNFSCALQENEAFKFSTLKRVPHDDVSWCGKSSVSDAQIISSCHFHRFHYNFPAFITLVGNERSFSTQEGLCRKLPIRQLESKLFFHHCDKTNMKKLILLSWKFPSLVSHLVFSLIVPMRKDKI